MLKSIARRIVPSKARPFARRVYYFGTRYRCSVCGSRVRIHFPSGSDFPVLLEFDVIGGEHFLHDTCPMCWSHSRTRLLYYYLAKEGRLDRRPQRILHFAPEYMIARMLSNQPGLEYVPVDIQPAHFADIPNIRCVDVANIPYSDNSFDAIICSHVLEHVPDDRCAMRELYRVLTPGGWAILQVPIATKLEHTQEDPSVKDPSERERRFGQDDHVRIYGADYVARLTSAAFRVERFVPSKRWGERQVRALRLNPREDLFIGWK